MPSDADLILDERASDARQLRRRIGRFWLGWHMTESYPRLCMELLKDVLVINTEYDPTRQANRYIAYSDKFEPWEREEGTSFTQAPTYGINALRRRLGGDTIVWKLEFEQQHPKESLSKVED